MQILNPLASRESARHSSARHSSWRQSSTEHILSPCVVDRQSASWDVEEGIQPRRGRRRRAPAGISASGHVHLEAAHVPTEPVHHGSAGKGLPPTTPGLLSLPDSGSSKGWTSLRKAFLEHKLEAVGQRERAHERKLGKINAFTSKLLGVFEHYVDADDDEATEGERQLLFYDNKKLVRYGVLLQCVGTTLSGVFIWLQLAACYVMALLIGFCGDGLVWSVHMVDLASLSSMTSSVCTLVAFMVGLCVSAALARWWQMREACLGGLWGCIDDLCLVAGTIFADVAVTHDIRASVQLLHQAQHALPENESPGAHSDLQQRTWNADDVHENNPCDSLGLSAKTQFVGPVRASDTLQEKHALQDRNLHDKVRLLRLGLASLALTFMQARGETSPTHLSELVVRRLITPSEFRILSRHMGKAPGQICWCWIAHMFTIAAAEGRIGQQKLWWLHSRCAEARGCIGRTFAYIDTQIPLAYIHLLALLVKLTLFVMSIEAGVALGLWLEQQQLSTTENADGSSQATEIDLSERVPFSLTIWALFLQGMLQVQAVLENPFGRDRLDFPAKAFHRYIRNEALSFLVSAEEFETAHPSFRSFALV